MNVHVDNSTHKTQLPNGVSQQSSSGPSSPPSNSLKVSGQRLLPNRQRQSVNKLSSSPHNNSVQEVMLAKLRCPPEFDPVFYAVLLQCELNGIRDLILAGFTPNARQSITPKLLMEIERLVVASVKLNSRTRLHLLGLVKNTATTANHSLNVPEQVNDQQANVSTPCSLTNGASSSGKRRTIDDNQPHASTSSKNPKLASKAASPPASSPSPIALPTPAQSPPRETSRPMLELSALALACAFSNAQLVRCLIELGADFNLVCIFSSVVHVYCCLYVSV